MEKVVSKDSKGEEFVVFIVKPNSKASTNAKRASNKAFSDALKDNCLLRKTVRKHMREQGLWDDSKQEELNSLRNSIDKNVRTLKRGGIELDDAKNIAIETRKLRNKMANLLMEETELDNFTAEAQADNTSFNSLVVDCTVTERGDKIFSSIEDYLSKREEPYAFDAAQKLGEIAFNLSGEWEKQLPENKFLLKYKFCNEELSLVNENGDLVSTEGKLIDKEGRYITEDGEFIDKFGNKVDEEGNQIEEFTPFVKNGDAVE